MFIIIKTIILGIVEGITEWLPISSTGHLILFNSFFNMEELMGGDFMSMFDVVIQLGAILAVVVIYFNKLWPFHSKSASPAFSQFRNRQTEGIEAKLQGFADDHVYMDKIFLWIKIIISVIPAVIIGLPLDDWLDAHLYNPITVALMLIIYGFLFILIERWNAGRRPVIKSIRRIGVREALLVGLFQCLAMIPGTSRSGATIIGGLLLGMSHTCIAEYTFYLAIPTMLGASLLKIVKFGLHFTSLQAAVLLIGCVVSFIVSIFAIRFLMSYIRRHDFKVFGYYRIIVGILVLILGAAGIVHA
ncbi:MAG: undecaprenyl-diphosphate phosphatase [Eubacterium sp.]|nr:undecaprenyl-diphosphate phosphatase [Eubacterium sp.]